LANFPTFKVIFSARGSTRRNPKQKFEAAKLTANCGIRSLFGMCFFLSPEKDTLVVCSLQNLERLDMPGWI